MSEKLKVIADFDAEFNAFFDEVSKQPVVAFPEIEKHIYLDAVDMAELINSFFYENTIHAHAA